MVTYMTTEIDPSFTAVDLDEVDALVGDIRPYINAALGLSRDEDGHGLAEMCSDALFDIPNLEALQDSNVRWNTKTGLEVAAKIQQWLDMGDADRLGSDPETRAIEGSHGDLEALTGLSDHVLIGHEDVLIDR